MKKTLLIIGAIAAGLYIIISFAKGEWKFWKWFAATPSTPPATNTPTNPSTYPGGFKWDATEKKCYGYDATGGSAWVSDEECTSRGVLTNRTRDISREIQIVQKAEQELSTARITNAGKVEYINKRLLDNGSDVQVIEKGTNPPAGRKTCVCGTGLETIPWLQWALLGCGSHSSGGSICIGYQ